MNFNLEFEEPKANMNLSMDDKVVIKVPAYTSELTNDSGFLTEKELAEAQDKVLSGYAKKEELPTKTSQLTNDSKFMTTTEVVNKINEAIADKTQFKFEVVDELPSVGEENVIYLAGWSSQEGNLYSEYLYVNHQWEMIGSIDMSLRNYYTSSYVDYLLETLEAAIKREIPTKTSQLENNSGFINGTGLQAAIDELKDYFFDEEEVTIEWDGNTTGREVYEMKGSITGTFYKVSDIVVKAEDIVGCTYYTKVGGDTENTVPARGTGALFGLYDNDYSWILIAAGMVCLYDDSQGCSPGLYFRVGPYEYDNSKTEFVTKLIVEHDKIKTELLPENIGGGSVESVNRKTGAVVLTAEDVGALPNTTKIPKKISDLENDEGYLKNYTETDPTVPAWAKNPTKPQYTASEVGADPSGTAAGKVAEHDTSTEAHNDIRLLIQGLTTRLNALANSDDTTLDQMAEVVAYIKSNRTLIESVTTGKVSVTDIIDNLTTNVADKPLSAAQGVILKDLIDTLQTAVNNIKVPTKTSQLTNDSKFMTTTEVVNKINEAISGLVGGLKFEIVDTIEDLPTWCDDSNTIYLVPSEKTEGNQYYNEYLWMDGRWEKFGDTQVNLDGYYTEIEVDNLIANVRKSIPTKVSQLYNDAGYITAGDLETGEATWDSIKGNIVYPIEEFIDWDGNTEGIYTIGTGVSARYKVSDRVLRGEEFQHSGMTITYDSGNTLGVASALGNTESNGQWYSSAYGIGCVFDSELAGHPEGIYFSAYNFSELGIPRKLGPFVKENIKHELLSGYFENVGGKDVIKEEYLPPIGGTVKSVVFTTVSEFYSWLTDNVNKVLKVRIFSGSLGGNSTIEYTSIAAFEDGRFYLERNLISEFYSSGVTMNYYANNLSDISNVGVVLKLNSGSMKFNMDGTTVVTQNERLDINDEVAQYIGATITVIYAD